MRGLQLLPKGAKGQCLFGDDHAGGATTVAFGEELAVSCTISYTPEELATMCQQRLALTAQPAFASLNLTDGSSRIGVFGDSHPTMAADWVPLTLRYPQNDDDLETTWDASTYECANVVDGVHLRVLVTEVGLTSRPVAQVLGAEALVSTRTLAARRAPLGAPADTVLTVTATVTFASLQAESFEYVPEAPQLIPPLPYDFFYPFTTAWTE